ncbi:MULTISPECIES: hypothetical protein [unclassified Kitasatospora]|uniref:hypothetical protein n=1 Tax=unclassified Kitasatospora TaxID=2633591 RepID=UPI001ADF623E|nr:hypothetical protein [Kitasatospora sp. RG8]MBP0455356.1 hypothetical protein [Kitasatospora sp. RG8]
MANNQSETPAPTTPATEAAVEAGKAVEGAVAASSNPAEYTEPTAGQKADLEDDLFGGEADRIVEPATPATTQEGPYEPQGIIASRP